ncbi:YecA family protein [Thiospirochaeta perfilievii]|nr:SEC-C metal-binding domain-containing protein [Thiospirochaeta perfilievii]
MGLYIRLFQNFKTKIFKDTQNLHDLEYDFSSLEFGIEENGTMVIYRDLFPYSNQFIFEYNDKTYLLVDYYCLNSSCKCKDVFFVVFEVHDKKVEEKKGYSEILYNYSKGTWANEVSIDGIMNELLKKYPDINLNVKKRHEILRKIYKKYLNENTGLNLQQFNQYKKIGRNDPCICGSGKKYKRCCG